MLQDDSKRSLLKKFCTQTPRLTTKRGNNGYLKRTRMFSKKSHHYTYSNTHQISGCVFLLCLHVMELKKIEQDGSL